MRAVIQRVSTASVEVDSKNIALIKKGYLILLGIERQDKKEDSLWLANKIANLRIFSDSIGKMNYSIKDVKGDIIVVSQFTLHAKIKKGNRPSYINAAISEKAFQLYENFKIDLSKSICKDIQSGSFGSEMKVTLTNDGPVTIIIDSKDK